MTHGVTLPGGRHSRILQRRRSRSADLQATREALTAEQGWVEPASETAVAIERLRGMPVDELLPHTARLVMPAFGDAVLPESPADALRAGRFHRVPVLWGATQDEGRLPRRATGRA
ncbi:hypothetical protein WME91_03475 [Sorangium sp. So ce269]